MHARFFFHSVAVGGVCRAGMMEPSYIAQSSRHRERIIVVAPIFFFCLWRVANHWFPALRVINITDNQTNEHYKNNLIH